MSKIKKSHFCILSALLCGIAANAAQAVSLDGRLYVDGFVTDADGNYADGSYFAMGANDPDGNVGRLQPAANGGYIELGSFQNFVTNPDVPHLQGWQGDTNGDGLLEGAAGAGYTGLASSANIFSAFSFFGVPTYVGTLPTSYQSGIANVAPTADVDLANCTGSVCAMTVNLSSWAVYWNGSSFDQGPRPSNVGEFVLAAGTFDLTTNHYELNWASQIKQGPFNGVKGYWHIEGVASIPEAETYAMMLAGLGLVGFVARRKKRVEA